MDGAFSGDISKAVEVTDETTVTLHLLLLLVSLLKQKLMLIY